MAHACFSMRCSGIEFTFELNERGRERGRVLRFLDLNGEITGPGPFHLCLIAIVAQKWGKFGESWESSY